jgi:hypothetical protein
MMEAVRTSETSVENHFTRQYIPEDNSEHQGTVLFVSEHNQFSMHCIAIVRYEYSLVIQLTLAIIGVNTNS